MKTATIPSLRVDAELREAAIDVLEDGETLSSFVTLALRESIERRQQDAAFLARGIRSRDEALASKQTIPMEVVMNKLTKMLADSILKKKRA